MKTSKQIVTYLKGAAEAYETAASSFRELQGQQPANSVAFDKLASVAEGAKAAVLDALDYFEDKDKVEE